jgi:hypothetical protein
VRVFEPLLFEECRAQLNSTYEELPESVSRDTYFTVRVKMVERRERGLYLYFFFTTYDQIVYFYFFFANHMSFAYYCLRNHVFHICNTATFNLVL